MVLLDRIKEDYKLLSIENKAKVIKAVAKEFGLAESSVRTGYLSRFEIPVTKFNRNIQQKLSEIIKKQLQIQNNIPQQ